MMPVRARRITVKPQTMSAIAAPRNRTASGIDTNAEVIQRRSASPIRKKPRKINGGGTRTPGLSANRRPLGELRTERAFINVDRGQQQREDERPDDKADESECLQSAQNGEEERNCRQLRFAFHRPRADDVVDE